MRNRTQDLASTSKIGHAFYGTTNSGFQDPTYNEDPEETIVTHGGTRVTNDIVTPEYRKRMKAGEIINNPYDSSLDYTDIQPWSYYQTRHYIKSGNPSMWLDYYFSGLVDIFNYGISETPQLPIGMPQVDIDSMKNRAISRAWAKVAETPTLALVTAAEAHKTYKLLLDMFRVAASLFRRGLRVKSRVAMGTMSAAKAAQAWLSIRYGLRPLYYDIKSTIEGFNSINRDHRARFAATVSDEDTVSQSFSDWSAKYLILSGTCYRKLQVEVSAGVLVKVNVTKIGLKKALGLEQLTLSAWELVPFSFIVDWFFNTADYIASWSPVGEVEPLTSWVVLRTKSEAVREVTDYEIAPYPDGYWIRSGATASAAGGSEKRTIEYTQRIPQPDKPLIPSLNIRLNVSKLIDILALIQNFK